MTNADMQMTWSPRAVPAPPTFTRRAKQGGEPLTLRSPLSWLIAGYFFYLPLANLPVFKVVRNGMLDLPVFGTLNQFVPANPLLLLLPDFVFGLVLFMMSTTSLGTRHTGSSPARIWFQIVFVLTVAGGVLSTVGSEFTGLAMAGLVTRLGVLIVGLVIVRHRPSPEVAEFWLFAALLGTTLIMLVGIVVYWSTFGLPESLADLPIRRSLPQWLSYQRVTFGHAANNTGLLLLTFPAVLVMLTSKRGGAVPQRAGLIAAIVVMVVSLFFSFQRWGFVCALLSVALVVWYWRSTWRAPGLLIVMTALYIVVGREIVRQLGTYFAQALFESGESSLARRMLFWEAGMDQVLRVPSGIGFGTANSLPLGGQNSSHNMLLDNAVETGVIGGVALAIWAVVAIIVLVRVLWRPRPTRDLAFAFALPPAIFVLFGTFFNGQMYLAGIIVWYAYLHLFTLVALVLIEDEPVLERAPSRARVALTGLQRTPAISAASPHSAPDARPLAPPPRPR